MSAQAGTRATVILTHVPPKLEKPYRIFLDLPVEDQRNIGAMMGTFMARCQGMGPVAAFELVYKLGLWFMKHPEVRHGCDETDGSASGIGANDATHLGISQGEGEGNRAMGAGGDVQTDGVPGPRAGAAAADQ